MKQIIIIFLMTLLTISVTYPSANIEAHASDGIHLVVDGNDITHLSEPVIENDRTLVPIRFISDEIGAEVSWNSETRTVEVTRGDDNLRLMIDSKLIQYDRGIHYQISDVAPRIINDRTYVPLRLVSNALGIGIEWDKDGRIVYVDSNKSSEIEPFYGLDIVLEDGTTIGGSREITVDIPGKYTSMDGELRLLLLDSKTGSGFIRGRGKLSDSTFTFIPHMEDKGDMVLVAVVCDEDGNIIEADAAAVTMDVEPEVVLPEIADHSRHYDSITMTPEMNFLASYVEYEFVNLENKKIIYSGTVDPYDSYTWTPGFYESGDYIMTAIAYDNDGNIYESEDVYITMDVKRILKLKGVSEGMIINTPVTLIASRNFDVDETQFIAVDRNTGVERILKTIPYGSYEWFPSAADGLEGEFDLKVRVKDSRDGSMPVASRSTDYAKEMDAKELDGSYYESAPVHVTVDTSPNLIIKGIGPNQVITSPVDIYSVNNAGMENIQYYLKNRDTGVLRMLGEIDRDSKLNYVPKEGDAGRVSIFARGYMEGRAIDSEYMNLSVYTGKTYSSRPLMDKSEFKDFVSEMAVESYKKTGMSAAFQTAQAIHESGWGQYIPVDKYEGTFSNNLFGIKGTGTNGSIIANTWEVYNGVSFRVDDYFRSYNTPYESWKDHKAFLQKERYAGFREVMHDWTLGAYAIRRAGYATDPSYPMKLMNIIKKYGLYELDRISI
ncbi:Flagellum-specific peptidoglycan hydrolase FlgJ [Dethiosulfatibacter aminovorans DSM 17477]|uniref:Flagellum-specific peptidoglycan hydrolase FlgJ n=1 Tax=Dethiosulfatibacter aminovorans DSM 17477 TaxID=1121476 RepID=A0A1M6AUD1_9FIRM|nr:glucosaminidase domain-containing protein [Dethiosulfatibacter aminovorans]SHI40021.1 Flagellum-specific peptidoglycan hydrolase FlgJ [Dethiosulfatibacter aminovorans DSM 17477]